MDFELSEDQEALAEGVAALCAGRFDIETVRSMATDGLDRGRWAELAETGVFSLTRPESDGGLGMGWADAAVVFEQLGRALVPGPLVATTLTAALIGLGGADGADGVDGVASADGADGVDGVASADGADGVDGVASADGADGVDGVASADGVDGVDGVASADGVDGAAIAKGAAQGTIVVGTQERSEGRCYVEFLPWIDTLVISDDEGLWSVDAASLRTAAAAPAAHPLDPLTPVTAVPELPQGRRIADAKTADEWRQCGALLTAALQLGLAVGATDLAVDYAKQREQFGKPIGTFQAVKHRCADMITRVEVLRAAVYAAGVTVDGKGVDDPAHSVAVAKVLASSAAAACGKDSVQVHGGMGYTWEVDAHLFLKRAWVHDLAFGDGDHYAERLASGLLSG